MFKKIQFEIKNGNLNNIKSILYISSIYQGDSVPKALDVVFDSKISKAIKVDSYKGELGKTIELYGNGNIDKLLLVGLGNKKHFNSDKLRAIAANIIRNIESNKITSVCIDSNAFSLSNHEYAQAFSEGLALGQYKFLDYKSKTNKDTKVTKVTKKII